MFDGKPRVGVLQHLKLTEFINAQRGISTVIYVAKHKLGDKRPATVILDGELQDYMDR